MPLRRRLHILTGQSTASLATVGSACLLGELITVAAYKLNIKIIVIKNNTLGQIKWEQMVFLGNPEYACDLYPADFVTIARGAGIDAIQIEDPATCGAQLDNVVGLPGPVLIEAVVDQFTPPMPREDQGGVRL